MSLIIQVRTAVLVCPDVLPFGLNAWIQELRRPWNSLLWISQATVQNALQNVIGPRILRQESVKAVRVDAMIKAGSYGISERHEMPVASA
jgi:hypothetical protein